MHQDHGDDRGSHKNCQIILGVSLYAMSKQTLKRLIDEHYLQSENPTYLRWGRHFQYFCIYCARARGYIAVVHVKFVKLS